MPRARRPNIGQRTRNANQVALLRRSQTADERAQANASQRERIAQTRSVDPLLNLVRRSRIRRAVMAEMMRAALNYNSQIDYSMYGYVGMMDAICSHCDAANFPGETPSICCANDSGPIYHQAGSLLPYPDADHQFLHFFFIGNENRELDQRCAIVSNTRRETTHELQRFFHQHNADANVVVLDDQLQSRDIVFHSRNDQLQRISELHRSYDALQYPILHWKGDDGYHQSSIY